MGVNSELVKIKLTTAQRDLIYINIIRFLNCDPLGAKHYKTFDNLEEKGVLIIDKDINVQFTDMAKKRLLKIGIDIYGNEEIKALKFDPIFLEYKKQDERWTKHCRRPYIRSKVALIKDEKLTDKIFHKFQNSLDNADCVFRALRDYVSEFMKRKKIPRTI